MVESLVKIKNVSGIHARPAADFIELAKSCESKITLIKGNMHANGKSILNVLAMNLNQGTEVLIRAEGADEKEAVANLEKYIDNLEE